MTLVRCQIGKLPRCSSPTWRGLPGAEGRPQRKGRRSRSPVTRSEAQRPCAAGDPAHTRTPGGDVMARLAQPASRPSWTQRSASRFVLCASPPERGRRATGK